MKRFILLSGLVSVLSIASAPEAQARGAHPGAAVRNVQVNRQRNFFASPAVVRAPFLHQRNIQRNFFVGAAIHTPVIQSQLLLQVAPVYVQRTILAAPTVVADLCPPPAQALADPCAVPGASFLAAPMYSYGASHSLSRGRGVHGY